MTGEERMIRMAKLAKNDEDIKVRAQRRNRRMESLGLSIEERKELSWFSAKDIDVELDRLEKTIG